MGGRYVPLSPTVFMVISFLCTSNGFTPADNYLIDCGSPNSTTIGQRTFAADASPSSIVSTPKNILAETNSSLLSSLDSSALYKTARIFTGPSSYTFQIKSPGRHFIRLYFFPFIYQSFDLTTAKFSVSTQDVTLLMNFQSKGGVFKEYSVNIARDTLVLSFTPSANSLLAFISAIEVVSVPDGLIVDTAQNVNPPSNYLGLSSEAFQTVQRVNMGGPKVFPDNDTIWRTWVNDAEFLLDKSVARSVNFSGSLNQMNGGANEDDAPDIVYKTATSLVEGDTYTTNAVFNVTWQFNVDSDSSYLIRLHFCDIISKALDELFFDVYVSSWAVLTDFDLSARAVNTLASPIFIDYVLDVGEGSGALNVSIGPSSLPNVKPRGILNGLEIMKIISGPGSDIVSSGSKSNVGIIVGAVLGAVAVVIAAIALFILLRRRKLSTKQQSKTWDPFPVTAGTPQSSVSRFSNGTTGTTGPNGNIGYQFSFVVLQEATNKFDENWVIGVGGFGKVYKGVLRDETKVAVKRGNPKSQQGLREFHTEIELLSGLRHRHLVSLIGYCDERNEMILVYEYMEKGTLKNHLYGSDLPALSWKQRLEICIGSARGLHYLHTGSAKAIIHRDVKSANILLDENLMAKVADFGLSKTGPGLDKTHVSTLVKGSFGYLDPEYYRKQQLTEKSDVYSFGVVLLEVICARPVINPTLPREMVNLAEWAMEWQKRRELDQIVDPRIAGTIKPESLRKFGETVENCLAEHGVERPSMGDVLWNLEYVLLLQEADSSNFDVNSINQIADLNSQVQNFSTHESTTMEVLPVSGGNDLSDVSGSKVFSQLIKSEGR